MADIGKLVELAEGFEYDARFARPYHSDLVQVLITKDELRYAGRAIRALLEINRMCADQSTSALEITLALGGGAGGGAMAGIEMLKSQIREVIKATNQ